MNIFGSVRMCGMCIFVVAALIRVGLLLHMRLEDNIVSYEPVRIALSLIKHGAPWG